MELTVELELAMRLADLADELSLRHFKSKTLIVETKPDMTPVSEADRAVETELRRVLAAERPQDGILGEEYGTSGTSTRQWVVDPIDGTKNYVRGNPIFATLIALAVDGVSVLGLVSAPALGRRWWATRGGGSYLNGQSIQVSAVRDLADAQISYNSVLDFRDHGYMNAGMELTERAWRTRGFGDFWSHVLVAEGAVDVAAEPVVAPWDLAALQIIVEEAGGKFTDFSGTRTYRGGSAVSSNGILHPEVLKIIRSDQSNGG